MELTEYEGKSATALLEWTVKRFRAAAPDPEIYDFAAFLREGDRVLETAKDGTVKRYLYQKGTAGRDPFLAPKGQLLVLGGVSAASFGALGVYAWRKRR